VSLTDDVLTNVPRWRGIKGVDLLM